MQWISEEQFLRWHSWSCDDHPMMPNLYPMVSWLACLAGTGSAAKNLAAVMQAALPKQKPHTAPGEALLINTEHPLCVIRR